MSFWTLNKLTTVNAPAVDKWRHCVTIAKLCPFYIDTNGAQWFYGKQRCLLPADLSADTSATLTNVTGMSFPVLANTRYGFRFNLLYQSAGTGVGINVGLTWPTTPTIISAGVDIFGFGAPGASPYSGAIFSGVPNVKSTATNIANTTYPVIIDGTLVVGSTSGVLQLQWATGTAATGVTPKQGSWGELWLL